MVWGLGPTEIMTLPIKNLVWQGHILTGQGLTGQGLTEQGLTEQGHFLIRQDHFLSGQSLSDLAH